MMVRPSPWCYHEQINIQIISVTGGLRLQKSPSPPERQEVRDDFTRPIVEHAGATVTRRTISLQRRQYLTLLNMEAGGSSPNNNRVTGGETLSRLARSPNWR